MIYSTRLSRENHTGAAYVRIRVLTDTYSPI